MTSNRFEQVDELQDDALNLSLAQTREGQTGRVRVPLSAAEGKLPGGVDSGDIPARDAFRGAIKLANDLKLAIVVIDPDNIWQKEWGELYRD
ncbi:hypothetical protein QM467_17225 [Rhodoblastus sp. 17X3]|uniref:hypothetical protein n=1 Tax=Rhodoblastus sp. 17X3 TaxID=3047026 RepID=UPI0024B80E01|nr:hypothetical protein [Rhodoblastus sp. 17X3]MDI9849790.1 hypothetical protein [Rhodoblastus sp. 17X3]